MDIDIVNTILRLCHEQQTCLFEVPTLVELCLAQRSSSNSKYVLASIKNYMEIFRISRDRNRIELFMPVSIYIYIYRSARKEERDTRKARFFLHLFVTYFSFFFPSLNSVEIILSIVPVK